MKQLVYTYTDYLFGEYVNLINWSRTNTPFFPSKFLNSFIYLVLCFRQQTSSNEK